MGTTTPVGSLLGCQSTTTGYGGVFDLSGNVWEWEDSCEGASGAQDECQLRGGSFYDDLSGVGLRCDINSVYPRGKYAFFIGFRCGAP